MSLQDDIFDVRHALRRRPEAREAFSRIEERFYDYETRLEQAEKIITAIRVVAIAALKENK